MMSRVFHSPPSLPRDPLQGWVFVLPVHLLLTVITNLLPLSPAWLSLQKQHPTYSFGLRFKNTFFKIWFSQTTFMNVKSWTEANPSPSLGKKLGAVTCSKQSRQILSSPSCRHSFFFCATHGRGLPLKDEQHLVLYFYAPLSPPELVPSLWYCFWYCLLCNWISCLKGIWLVRHSWIGSNSTAHYCTFKKRNIYYEVAQCTLRARLNWCSETNRIYLQCGGKLIIVERWELGFPFAPNLPLSSLPILFLASNSLLLIFEVFTDTQAHLIPVN